LVRTNTTPPYPSTHTPKSSSLLAPSGTNRGTGLYSHWSGPTRLHHTPRLAHRDPRRYWLPQVPIGEQGFILTGQNQHDSTIPLDSHTEILFAIGSLKYSLCGYWLPQVLSFWLLVPQVPSLWLLAPSGTLFVAIGSLRYSLCGCWSLRYPLCGYWLPQVPSLWLYQLPQVIYLWLLAPSGTLFVAILAPSGTIFVAIGSLRYPLCGYIGSLRYTLCHSGAGALFSLVRPYPSTHTPRSSSLLAPSGTLFVAIDFLRNQ
jgi:hypothetical protein